MGHGRAFTSPTRGTGRALPRGTHSGSTWPSPATAPSLRSWCPRHAGLPASLLSCLSRDLPSPPFRLSLATPGPVPPILLPHPIQGPSRPSLFGTYSLSHPRFCCTERTGSLSCPFLPFRPVSHFISKAGVALLCMQLQTSESRSFILYSSLQRILFG